MDVKKKNSFKIYVNGLLKEVAFFNRLIPNQY